MQRLGEPLYKHAGYFQCHGWRAFHPASVLKFMVERKLPTGSKHWKQNKKKKKTQNKINYSNFFESFWGFIFWGKIILLFSHFIYTSGMWAQNEDGFTLVHLCSTSLAMQRAGISWVLGLDSSYLGALHCWEKRATKTIKFPLWTFWSLNSSIPTLFPGAI